MAVKVAVAVKEKAHRRYAPKGCALLLIYTRNTCVYFFRYDVLVELNYC